jgi:hypothetical protein
VDHRIEITIPDDGRHAETGDRLIEAFYEFLPAADAVIDQNLEAGLLTATFFLEGGTATEAAKAGVGLFELAADRAGMDTPDSVSLAVLPQAR